MEKDKIGLCAGGGGGVGGLLKILVIVVTCTLKVAPYLSLWSEEAELILWEKITGLNLRAATLKKSNIQHSLLKVVEEGKTLKKLKSIIFHVLYHF